MRQRAMEKNNNTQITTEATNIAADKKKKTKKTEHQMFVEERGLTFLKLSTGTQLSHWFHWFVHLWLCLITQLLA